MCLHANYESHLRKSGGKIITQPNCHKYRAWLSKSPKKHTGANRKRMAKKSALMGTVPKRMDRDHQNLPPRCKYGSAHF